MPELGGPQDTPTSPVRPQSGTGLLLDEKQDYKVEDELTPEQLQIYEKDNQDMLKHYEATLDQVQYVIHWLIGPLYTNLRLVMLTSH